jgi:hypothetical protein
MTSAPKTRRSRAPVKPPRTRAGCRKHCTESSETIRAGRADTVPAGIEAGTVPAPLQPAGYRVEAEHDGRYCVMGEHVTQAGADMHAARLREAGVRRVNVTGPRSFRWSLPYCAAVALAAVATLGAVLTAP